MNKFIEADGEIIKITFVVEDKPDEPKEHYVIAEDLKQAISILEAYTKKSANPILVNKAEYVSSLVLCDIHTISDKVEHGY
jgi:hypothetical protein